jgi:DNA-binding transcriptional LysR family regulator
VECGNFTSAANHLNVSTAWVSSCIARLETQFGVTLFTRSTRHMQITNNGKHCLAKAILLINQWQELEDDLMQSHNSTRGKLRISLPVSWGLSQFGVVLTAFGKQYPDIVLDINLSDSYVNVLGSEFDLVLRLASKLADSSLICQKITDYRRIACATPEYLALHGEPSHPKHLNGHSCLMYNLPGAPIKWQFMEEAKLLDIYLEPRHLSNNSQLLHYALMSSQGIALIPEFIVDDDLKTGRLVPILTDFETMPLNLYSIRPNGQRSTYRLRLLQKFIMSHYSGR